MQETKTEQKSIPMIIAFSLLFFTESQNIVKAVTTILERTHWLKADPENEVYRGIW